MQIKDQDTIADLIPLRDTLLPKLADWLSIFTRLDCKASKLEICTSYKSPNAPRRALIWLSTHFKHVQAAFNNYNGRSETSSTMQT